ncbi:MAG: protein-disulfide reductase DsbD domain-containing protein [Planktotalea sp.]|uniref:protein-disulfide reductase DsbD domain-containing protein n=1 Tax=Planktotalea sp. TaxID=2029877 RepID=UPI003C70A21D
MRLRKTLLAALALLASPVVAFSQSFDDVLVATLLTGWRQSDGSHMAAVQLSLKPGWHTYWRAPGDAGIPPLFDLSGSGNFKGVQVIWPRPDVYTDNGLRSIVYYDEVVLPLRVMPKANGKDIALTAKIDVGICKDICVPQTLNVSAVLPATANKRDPRIAAALADRPFSGKQAGAKNLRCQISPSADGIKLATTLTLPRVGQREAVIIETADPLLWVAEPEVTRNGNQLSAITEIQNVEGAPFMLNRSGIRITVLGESRAVEINGCKGG